MLPEGTWQEPWPDGLPEWILGHNQSVDCGILGLFHGRWLIHTNPRFQICVGHRWIHPYCMQTTKVQTTWRECDHESGPGNDSQGPWASLVVLVPKPPQEKVPWFNYIWWLCFAVQSFSWTKSKWDPNSHVMSGYLSYLSSDSTCYSIPYNHKLSGSLVCHSAVYQSSQMAALMWGNC
jgi:hypothetical protein